MLQLTRRRAITDHFVCFDRRAASHVGVISPVGLRMAIAQDEEQRIIRLTSRLTQTGVLTAIRRAQQLQGSQKNDGIGGRISLGIR